MTSQERFWQARLMSKEAEHRGELSEIHQQLDALKVRHVNTFQLSIKTVPTFFFDLTSF